MKSQVPSLQDAIRRPMGQWEVLCQGRHMTSWGQGMGIRRTSYDVLWESWKCFAKDVICDVLGAENGLSGVTLSL